MSKVQIKKRMSRLNRRARVRRKIRGTSSKPRLSIYRSLNHIYAQIIDDETGKTLVSASSLRIELPEIKEPAPEEGADKKGKKGKKGKARKSTVKFRRSEEVGRKIAEKAIEKGIDTVVFDRCGFLYHGRVAALADAAREGGLKF